jgi:methylthioribose-1-phosphate isomerase
MTTSTSAGDRPGPVSNAVPRTIDWVEDDGVVRLIDQTRLPAELVQLPVRTVDELIGHIRRLAVRGAPALGVAGAMGVALAAQQLRGTEFLAAVARLREARPTAVNLAVGVDRAHRAYLVGGPEGAIDAARRLRDEEIHNSVEMGRLGAALLAELTGNKPRLSLLTVCNTGSLAAVEHGTALSVAFTLHREAKLASVTACETRPLLQGARLTAWELGRVGAPYRVIVDSAAASVLVGGSVDAVLVGADRIAANGDTANKIGTLSLAIAARYAGVPFLVVAPETTVDPSTPTGADITVEDRAADEIRTVHGVPVTPADAPVLNPAFDVTPADLITAIVTNKRVIRPTS